MQKSKKYFVIVFVFFGLQFFGQSKNYKSMIYNSQSNFFEVVAQQRQQFINKKLSGKWTHKDQKAYKQFERWVYIWKDRINHDGTFPAQEQMLDKDVFINLLLQNNQQRSTNSTWINVGPSSNVNMNGYTAYPGMGRINVVAVNPSNENIMYAGAASGGVWKTTNAGSSWTPISDNFAGLGVSDILIDPTNPNVIYVATGDEDGVDIASIGIFKSTNGGNTWTATGLTFSLSQNEFVRDLAFAPGNSNKIFALTNNDIKVSTNGGTSWSNVSVNYSPYGSYTPYFQTIVFDPNDANKVVVSDSWSGIYFSTDGGNTFALHQGFALANAQKILKLTTTPNDTNNFYALDETGHFMKFRFNINNTSSDKISDITISGYNSQNGYNMALAVSPTNKNNIIVGGVRGYTSTNNGASFSVKLNPYNSPPGVGFYVHPDHHYLGFLSNGTTVIDGHDGGVHKGGFSANIWTDISNGLVITQSYNIAVSQTRNGDDFIMANQDNDGFSKVLKNGMQQWVAAVAGDGTAAGIDYSSTNIRYLGSVNGCLDRTNDGYASNAISATEVLPSTPYAAYISPMEVHPVMPMTIYAAHQDILVSNDSGNSWAGLTCGTYPVDFINVTPYMNGMATQIYVIGNGVGRRSIDGGATWQALNLPHFVINSIVARPNSDIVFASAPGYGVNKVLRSADGGNTWLDISAGLPNVAMKRLLLKTDMNNETLYIGTEIGVYWKDNTMSAWQKLGTGLPNVIVTDLRINYADQDLYVGTFGRGMWKISVGNPSSITFNEDEKPIIYPNPVTNQQIHVNINETLLAKGKLSYKVYNVVGGIVSEGKVSELQTTIKLGKLGKGMYMLKIENKNKSMIFKFVVE